MISFQTQATVEQKSRAIEITQIAEKACLISNALRGTVRVTVDPVKSHHENLDAVSSNSARA